MQTRRIELNEIVCIEVTPDGATVHMLGGAYFNVPMEVAKDLQLTLKDRLLKVMSVFGDPDPKNGEST